jgi:hypothetical protein
MASQMIAQMNGAETMLNSLSYDAMLEVLSHLSVQELGRLSNVSQNARDFADDEAVWRRLCRQMETDWSKILKDPSQQKSVDASGTWKDQFKTERDRLACFSKFVGLWSEKWCDVHVMQSTQIETDGTNFFVTYKKNKFSAHFQSFDGETLSFQLEGGDSGWSFVYSLKPLSENLLQLTVFRSHDKKSFTGFYTRG